MKKVQVKENENRSKTKKTTFPFKQLETKKLSV
jgi:hypothetical protein